MQELGLLALRLDEHRRRRLHVWDPEGSAGDLTIHDHPFDLTSTVIAGAITNTRYLATPSGVEHVRERYVPPDEDHRRRDTVRLSGTATTYTAGQRYEQRADELHSSAQLPGTVTVLHMTFTAARELTVCRPPGRPWVSGRSRPATPDEVERITARARTAMG